LRKLLILGLITLFVAAVFAADRKVGDYTLHGKFDYQLVQTAFDSNGVNFKSNIVAVIDTVSAIAHRPIITSLQPSIATATGDDSIYYGGFAVPAGMTAKIQAITLSAAVEYDVANPANVELMVINVVDTDTIVEPFSIDEDSCVYNNVALALTIYDTTTLDAGDVVQAYVMGDSTLDVVCEGCILTFDVDFNE